MLEVAVPRFGSQLGVHIVRAMGQKAESRKYKDGAFLGLWRKPTVSCLSELACARALVSRGVCMSGQFWRTHQHDFSSRQFLPLTKLTSHINIYDYYESLYK